MMDQRRTEFSTFTQEEKAFSEATGENSRGEKLRRSGGQEDYQANKGLDKAGGGYWAHQGYCGR